MRLVDTSITAKDLKKMAENMFGNLVKAVVDIEKEIMVVDAEMHSDEEAHLLDLGSKQENLWGINIYPDKKGEEMIEFDSMINLRPSQGNNSRGIDDESIQKRILAVISKLISS